MLKRSREGYWALPRIGWAGALWVGTLYLAPMLGWAQAAAQLPGAPAQTWLRPPTLGTYPLVAMLLFFAVRGYREGRLTRLGALNTALCVAIMFAMPTLVRLGRLGSGPTADPMQGIFILLPLTATVPLTLVLLLTGVDAYRSRRLTPVTVLATAFALALVLAIPGIVRTAMTWF